MNYIVWHYSQALADIYRHWKNSLWFLWNYFSIGILFRTLFSPYKRMGELAGTGFHPGEWIAAFIINTIMRTVGLIMRLILIMVGFICIILAILSLPVVLTLWLISPAIIVLLFLFGLGVFKP